MSKTPESPFDGGHRRRVDARASYAKSLRNLKEFVPSPFAAEDYVQYRNQINDTLPHLRRFMLRKGTIPQNRLFDERKPQVLNYIVKNLSGDPKLHSDPDMPDNCTERLFVADITRLGETVGYSLAYYQIRDEGPLLDSAVLLTQVDGQTDIDSFMAVENTFEGHKEIFKPVVTSWDMNDLQRFDAAYKGLLSDLLFEE